MPRVDATGHEGFFFSFPASTTSIGICSQAKTTSMNKATRCLQCSVTQSLQGRYPDSRCITLRPCICLDTPARRVLCRTRRAEGDQILLISIQPDSVTMQWLVATTSTRTRTACQKCLDTIAMHLYENGRCGREGRFPTLFRCAHGTVCSPHLHVGIQLLEFRTRRELEYCTEKSGVASCPLLQSVSCDGIGRASQDEQADNLLRYGITIVVSVPWFICIQSRTSSDIANSCSLPQGHAVTVAEVSLHAR